MLVDLSLSLQAEMRLRRQAERAGISSEEFVLRLLERYALERNATDANAKLRQSVDHRRLALERIARRHRHPGSPADSSRDTIYADRKR